MIIICQAELRAEERRYRDYLRQVRDDERRRERELESVCDAEVERMWEQRVRQWRAEKAARQKLLDEVVEARRQQIQQRRASALAGYTTSSRAVAAFLGGSVAEWLACWTRAQKGPCSNRSRDAIG